MKSYWTVLPLSALLACGGGNSGADGRDEGGRRVEDLGRFVSGSRQLSEYYQYDQPCNYISESAISTMFDLPEGTVLTWMETESTCDIVLNNKKVVSLSTTARRPFESIFHAEYYFDRLFKPEDLTDRGRKQYYTGPDPMGTGAEGPADGLAKTLEPAPGATAESGAANNPSPGNGAPAGAPNDSAARHSEPGGIRAQLDDNEEQRNSPKSVPGVAEKAVWDAKNRTLHILNLQHVFHIMVKHGPTVAADSAHAAHLASLLISQVDEETNVGSDPIY
ncbi:hypothetical protein ACO2Q8_14775 [Larkinella sp. VNQ87]|uniref:hypothetical protein n=1 Tax=Larkinella sp. VNQ87 TaxID=3400921 RepID=UPI003C03143A